MEEHLRRTNRDTQRALREKWGVKKSTMKLVGPTINAILKNQNSARTKISAMKLLSALDKNERPEELTLNTDNIFEVIREDLPTKIVTSPETNAAGAQPAGGDREAKREDHGGG